MNYFRNRKTSLDDLQNEIQIIKNNRTLQKAQKFLLRGQLKRCIQECLKVQGDNNVIALAKVLHAACLSNLEEKEKFLSDALALDHGCANAYYAKGCISLEKKHFDEAIIYFKYYLNFSKSEQVYSKITCAFLCVDKFEEAYHFVKEGLHHNSNSPQLNILLAEIVIESPVKYHNESEYKSVLKYLDIAEKGGVSKEVIYWFKAKYYYEKKEYAKAYETISKYLKINYFDNEARWVHNMCLFYLGDLINFVGYVLVLYDESDDFAITLVNKFNLLDFEEEVLNDSFTKEEVVDLNKRILNRIRGLI